MPVARLPGSSAPSASPPDRAATEDALARHFGLEKLRPWQEEAIGALLGEPGRVLVIAPTGGGKSLTYQLPAVLLPGTTLVLSPLVALMEDQVRALEARGIPATFLAATLDPSERHAREGRLARGQYKLVYAAPERLASDAFVALLDRSKIDFVAIDEAHCISQWGHDFRPDYRRIGALLRRLGPRRILACTATATPDVRKDIRAQLGLDDPPCREVLRGFARPNLHLAAKTVEGPKEARAELLAALKHALGSPARPNGTGIVYAATRKSAETHAEWLRQQGFKAAHYHAGEGAETRSRVQADFASGRVPIIVATNAFGMGIDRPDTRVVVHVQPPASIEAYYQEVGRAGRDGADAHGLLLCSGLDIALRRRLAELGEGGGAAPPATVARAWGLFRELLRYLDARSCRHDFVLRYFGDEHEVLGGCGHCDVCEAIEEERAQGEEGRSGAPSEETTLIVRKALSGVARAGRRAGLGAICDMLRGQKNERLRRFGFDELSTFGLLADRSQAWVMAVLRGLLAAGWIDLTPSEHPVPFLTVHGTSVMKGLAPAHFSLPPQRRADGPRGKGAPGGKAEAKKTKSELDELSPETRRVLEPAFERLRACRAALARELGLPAYVVAHDKTLLDVAVRRPRTLDELARVKGFGAQRAERYGPKFLATLEALSPPS
jgi:ATP-dependent DNA helicase RecQ